MRVHVIPLDPFRPIPQKAQFFKDPSRETRKFTGLENLVPIPSRDSSLRARPVVQVHDYHLYSRAVWIYLLPNKREAPTHLKNFIALVDRQFETKISAIRMITVMSSFV